MKSYKELLAELSEARMIATGDYRISSSGRKVRRLIKIGDDEYNKADDVDKDGDVDVDDEKTKKMRGESFEQMEQLDDVTWYDGSDMLGEAQARYSSSYQFTHKPGDEESEKKLADLKKSVKGTGKRVVLQGRLGKNNPNAHKYSKNAPQGTFVNGKRTNSDVSGKSGAHTHQRIQKADAAHHDVYVYDKADTQYDADTISEAVSVKKDNYSWGKMVTVHHGADTSYPLHPEHQSLIKKLKDGEKTSFKDETNSTVHAHREGDNVHLSRPKHGSTKTTVAHSHFTEEVNKSDVPAYLRKKTGDKLTLSDLRKELTKNRSHPETIKKINGTQQNEEAEQIDENRSAADRLAVAKQMYDQKMKSAQSPADRAQAKDDYDHTVKSLKQEAYSMDDVRKDAADSVKKSIDKQSDDRIAALKDKKKPESFLAKVGRKQINMVKGAWHGLTKEETLEEGGQAPGKEKSVVDDVPFDKPYKTVDKEVTTDKSGAKHGPMSKARHLARIALQPKKNK